MKSLWFALACPVAFALGCGADDAPTNVTGGTGGTGVPAAGAGGTGAGAGGTAGSPAGGAGAGAGAGGMGMSGSAAVSYSRDIAPIFASSCVLCHYTGGILIDIAHPFTPTTGLVSSDNTWAGAHPEANLPAKNLVPGNPDQSFIMMKIGNPNLPAAAGAFMPWQIERLTDAQIASLRQWITAGAANDATYASTIQPIFGTPAMLGTAGGKCTYCHFTGGELPNLSDPFNPTSGAVGVASFQGGGLKLIEPGNPDASFLITKVTATSLPDALGRPMPFRPPPLSTEEVALVRQWIVEGAQNN